ncbi:MAG: hypothetical protein KAI72_01510 [Candidatus Pacebacteria bacterium]|nr:hypothetical protein [Candidatus Paceibacterota bacterium]
MKDYDVTKVNGNPQPPDEVNNIFAEAKTMVSSLGIAFNSGSYQQLAESIAVLVMNGQYFIESGTANTYVVSVSPVTRKAPPSYFLGMMVAFVAANASTGASTINISGLGVKSIKQPDGTAIITGDILTTGLTTLYYDGTNFVLIKNPVNLASNAEVKGILPVANGGTGLSTGLNLFQTGMILLWSGAITAIPTGWVICDGNNSTPNLTDRFVIHADSDSGGTRDVGGTGGANTHTLTVAEMPPHGHPETYMDNSGGGTVSPAQTQTGATQSFTSDSVGGGAAHNNMPKYYALAYIMKT